MEGVQETSPNVIITSSEQEYELQEIQLEQRKPHIEDQGESQQVSQVDLISQSGNSTMKRNLCWKNGAANACTKRSSSKCAVISVIVAAFVFILFSLVLSLLAVFTGILKAPSPTGPPGYDKEAIKSLMQSVHDLKRNVSTLQELLLDVTEQKLQDFDQLFLDRLTSVNATLTNQISTVLKMQGPRGPAGYNGSQGFNGSQGPAGPPGPKGAGNFSQCQYKFKESSRTISGPAAKIDVTVVEPSDTKRIVGATCSTDDAAEYRLSSGILPSGRYAGKRFYKCKCAGQSDIMKDGGGKMKCILHYWECPIMP